VSQFPQPPYSPQPYSQYSYPPGAIDFSRYAPMAYPDLLAPARRASILQGVLGCMMLLCGACIGSMMWVVDFNEMMAKANVNYEQMMPGVTMEELRKGYTIVGAIGVAIGIALIALAVAVRRGTAAPAVISAVLCVLVAIVLGINIVTGLLMAVANPVAGILGVLMIAVPLAMFGVNIGWLVGVIRNASQINVAQQQYQAQFYQYQQHQQAYSQGAYGYPQPTYGYAPATPPQGQAPAPAPPPAEPPKSPDAT
jgi:hypothetical protein